MSEIYFTLITIILFISSILSNPVNNDAMYGCGPMGMNIDPLLKILQREQIIPCCVQHDICYRTCNKTRLQCDCAFYDCIIQKCINRVPLSIDCFNYATQFYKLVRTGGIPSYRSDQKGSGCPSSNTWNEFQELLVDQTNSTDIKFCDQKKSK